MTKMSEISAIFKTYMLETMHRTHTKVQTGEQGKQIWHIVLFYPEMITIIYHLTQEHLCKRTTLSPCTMYALPLLQGIPSPSA